MANLLIKATQYKAIQARMKDLQAELEELKAEIVSGMDGQEKAVVGQYTIWNKTVSSMRFDTKTFEQENPELANRYKKESVCTRFEIK